MGFKYPIAFRMIVFSNCLKWSWAEIIHRHIAAWYNNKWQEANQVTVYERGRCLDVRTRDKNSVSGLVQYVTSSVFEWNIVSPIPLKFFSAYLQF